MSIVSGLATAPGISSLLNARREASSPMQVAASDLAIADLSNDGGGGRRSSGGAQTSRPVLASDDAEAIQTPIRRESADPRYTQFIDAVTALRVDLSEEALTRERVAELAAAAKAVFDMDGVPTDRRPSPGEAVARDNSARAENAERTAERRRTDVRRDESRRAEIAAQREADEIARQQLAAAAASPPKVSAAPVPAQARPTEQLQPAVRSAPDIEKVAVADKAPPAPPPDNASEVAKVAVPEKAPAAPPPKAVVPPAATFTAPQQLPSAAKPVSTPEPAPRPAQTAEAPKAATETATSTSEAPPAPPADAPSKAKPSTD
ncbi:MAG: hypothetical protein AB8B85_22240 [Paracoccaceae bacterium]